MGNATRNIECERQWFAAELAGWVKSSQRHGVSLAQAAAGRHRVHLPHRDFLSNLLNALDLRGVAVEIGVFEGGQAQRWLRRTVQSSSVTAQYNSHGIQ